MVNEKGINAKLDLLLAEHKKLTRAWKTYLWLAGILALIGLGILVVDVLPLLS